MTAGTEPANVDTVESLAVGSLRLAEIEKMDAVETSAFASRDTEFAKNDAVERLVRRRLRKRAIQMLCDFPADSKRARDRFGKQQS